MTYGELEIHEIRLLAPEGAKLTKATPNGAGRGFGASVRMDGKYVFIRLSEPVKVEVGEALEVEVG